MQPVFWCFALLYGVVVESRRTGPAGLRRFAELDPHQARGIVDLYQLRWTDWILGVWAATNAVYAVVALTEGDPASTAVATLATLLAMTGLLLRRHNRPIILAAAETREIADRAHPGPLTPRDTSKQRQRRQRQFGTVAVGGLLTFPVVIAVAEIAGSSLLLDVGLVLLLIAVIAAAAFGWATAWVYGDEKPAV